MRSRNLVLAVAVVIFAAGCAGEAEPAHELERPRVDPMAVLAQTSEYQKPALADGQVTFAEYERAVLATVECLKGGGLTVDGPQARDGGRFLDFSFGAQQLPGESSGDADKRIRAISDRCDREYRLDIDRLWVQQHLLTTQQRDEQRTQLITCLRDAGAPIKGDASEQDIFEVVTRGSQDEGITKCQERFPDFFVVGVR